jgi:hypothetical protein
MWAVKRDKPLRRKTPLPKTPTKTLHRDINGHADVIGISDHDLEEEYAWRVFSVDIHMRDRISVNRGQTHWNHFDVEAKSFLGSKRGDPGRNPVHS